MSAAVWGQPLHPGVGDTTRLCWCPCRRPINSLQARGSQHALRSHVGLANRKIFRSADDASQVPRDERLDAGDGYDVKTPSDRTLRQPIERMRAFEAVQRHLIPGNHDAHTPRGSLERLRRLGEREGLPADITLHLAPEPAPIVGGAAFLLPSVLTRRHVAEDLTAWMDAAATPDGAIRIPAYQPIAPSCTHGGMSAGSPSTSKGSELCGRSCRG